MKPSNIAGRRTVCLAGDTDEAAARSDTSVIWEALQGSARNGLLNAQQLFVSVGTADQALPYLAGLSAQHCDLVITVGPTFGQALGSAAKANPRTTFVAVTAEGQTTPAGVETITGSDAQKAEDVRRRALASSAPDN